MPNPYRRARVGDPLEIPAATWNRFIDASAWVEGQQQPGTAAGSGEAAVPAIGPSVVVVRNDSGSDLPHLGVLGINGPIFTPTDNLDLFRRRVLLSGVTPTSTHLGLFVVALEPIENGELGRAFIDGVFPAKVNVTDASHQWADVTPGDATQLTSGATGSCRILYAPAGTGTKDAIVQRMASWVAVTGTEGEEVSPAKEVNFNTTAGTDPGDVTFTVTDGGDGQAQITATAKQPNCNCDVDEYLQLGPDDPTDATQYAEASDESDDGHCVQTWEVARLSWSSSSGAIKPKLYAYYRSKTYNKCGNLEAVGPEVRVLVIDTEAGCSP